MWSAIPLKEKDGGRPKIPAAETASLNCTAFSAVAAQATRNIGRSTSANRTGSEYRRKRKAAAAASPAHAQTASANWVKAIPSSVGDRVVNCYTSAPSMNSHSSF
jgi:hypothetical protein